MELSEARKRERYSQRAVASYLGVSAPTYAKMERDPGSVTVADAKRLAELFKVKVSDIFFS